MMKKIGVGYENFKKLIDDGCYFVDKSLLIRDVVEKGGAVTLFTRPRRFGKTLAMSMLQTFFEKEIDRAGEWIDNSHYFIGLKIMDEREEILSKMGTYPVIKLSLKSARQGDFASSFLKIRDEIVGEFERHSYLKNYMGADTDKITEYEYYEQAMVRWMEREKTFKSGTERDEAIRVECSLFSTALKKLSEFLKRYLDKKVIILIDEYDVPLENAYYGHFYDRMVGFIRSLFESALKTNDALEFGIVTGCLRISKESIFTGLNNLKINSILSGDFSEGFGFTQSEIDELLTHYDLMRDRDEVRDWYDGYLFGNKSIYNPWSVICYIDEKINGKRLYPRPYWANTSSNSIVKNMIEKADENVRNELDQLISGNQIEKIVHEDITYEDIDRSEGNLWNFLFFTGYLKKISESMLDDDIVITLTIPNREVRSIYSNHIREWFDNKVKALDFGELYRALLDRNTEYMSDYISEILSKSISYFDGSESFYHGYMLQLLSNVPGYFAKSNREVGNGRPDIVLYPNRAKDPVYIFELKARKKFNEMEDGIEEAFLQIRDMKYIEGALEEGYVDAIAFGVCFCKKSCIIRELKRQKQDN